MTQQQKKLSLGFSPCPNDTFIFDALVHGKIDTEGLRFEPVLEDVESLNERAFKNSLDISKLSFHAFAQVIGEYELLTAGSALGHGVGPLFISKKEFQDPAREVKRVAIPGKNTTANFLFSIFFPQITGKVEMVFSEIENALLSGIVDAGVIIHENRFTYQQKGLKKICDLGELWEKETGQPVPLGGIAVKRSIDPGIRKSVNRVLRRSVEYAFANPGSSKEYVKKHSQEISEEVQRQHIGLYVNNYSIDLGDNGRKAIETLFRKATERGIIKPPTLELFIAK